jgi:ABC-type antimicrobial peptide transport system permease subunit
VQEKAPPIVYWPVMAVGYWGPDSVDATRSATFIVRSDRAGTESFLNELRQAVWSLNSNVPVASMRTMQDIYGQSMARTSFTLVMLGIAGAMALILGFVGIYGVISYAVSQRTREIGIRLALGAERAKISRMVIGQGLRLALAGVAAGAVATLVLGRSFSSFSQLLYGVRVTNPAILATVSSAVVIVAVVACYLPARRAASVEPMKALRSE